MKVLFLFIAIISFNLQAATVKWEQSQGINTPESSFFHKRSRTIFVSNIVGDGQEKDGEGHISRLDTKGNIISEKWVEGLNAPKGMRSFRGYLWVTDIDEVLVIRIRTAQIVKRIPIVGAVFLNDVAIARNGEVYVSDTFGGKIHKIRHFTPEVFVEGDHLGLPNGLLVKRNKLFVASFGSFPGSGGDQGTIYSINLRNKNIKAISKAPLGYLDGLEMGRNGKFLVSDFVAGKIYEVSRDGMAKLIYTGDSGLADIGYIRHRNTIIFPEMNSNRVSALKL